MYAIGLWFYHLPSTTYKGLQLLYANTMDYVEYVKKYSSHLWERVVATKDSMMKCWFPQMTPDHKKEVKSLENPIITTPLPNVFSEDNLSIISSTVEKEQLVEIIADKDEFEQDDADLVDEGSFDALPFSREAESTMNRVPSPTLFSSASSNLEKLENDPLGSTISRSCSPFVLKELDDDYTSQPLGSVNGPMMFSTPIGTGKFGFGGLLLRPTLQAAIWVNPPVLKGVTSR